MKSRELPLLRATARAGEGLSHPQKAAKGFPQTLPSPPDAFVIELLVALHPTSWKLFERFPPYSDKKAIFKPQSTSQVFSGQPKPPVIASLGREKEREREKEPTQMYSNQNLFSWGEPTEQSCRLCISH